MKLIKTITTLLVTLSLAIAGPAMAGGPHVRVFDSVSGGTLNVAGSAFDLSEFSLSGDRGAGKVDFAVGNEEDARLLQQMAKQGRSFRSATLSGKDKQGYYEITLSDVIISSYQSGGSASGDTVPMDSFSLNFGKIEFQY